MRLALGLVIIAIVATALPDSGRACGDKFLVNSKGVNVQGILSATSPGAVVFYRNPDSQLATSALDDELLRDLTAAGHKVEITTSFDEALAMLTSGRYDIVVSDIADADRLAQAAPDANTHLLPVVDKKSKDEIKAAKGRFGDVLKAPGKSSYMVLQIDETVRKARKASS